MNDAAYIKEAAAAYMRDISQTICFYESQMLGFKSERIVAVLISRPLYNIFNFADIRLEGLSFALRSLERS